MQIKPFKLEFLGEETHLLLPNITSIVLAQNLYDVLFQYAISPEKEEMLKSFIQLLESHIKSKSRAPFSLPLPELAFLEEGLQELKLLNWMEVSVAIFHLALPPEASEDDYENTREFLQGIFVFNNKAGTNDIYVYPMNLTIF